jgi:hypothetical protein
MAAAGKKLRGHGARNRAQSPAASVSDGGYGARPHPTPIRAGQRFWPRSRRTGRRRSPLEVRSVRAGSVVVSRLDRARERSTIAASRLQAAGPDGQGVEFQFLGWRPRRYATWAVVGAADGDCVMLVLPEWHPGRPVMRLARLLPPGATRPGEWLALEADLSAPYPARLNLSDLERCADPGERCPRPIWTLGR